MKTALFTIVSMLIALSVIAENNEISDPEAVFKRANQVYKAAEYDSALTLYKQLDSSGYISGKLYYNMGNAYFKIGKTAYAVLYYERALKMLPGDKDVKHNLEFARQMTIDNISAIPAFFFEEWRNKWRSSMSTSGFITLSILFFWIAVFGITAAVTNFARLRKTGFYTAIISSIIFLLFTLSAIDRYSYLQSDREAVITASTVKVKSEPSGSSKTLFVIHSGLKVSVRKTEDDQAEIELPDGRVGWISKDELVRI